MTIEEYCAEHQNWSQATFGPSNPEVYTEKLLNHIQLEIEEVRTHPRDLEEWVDIIILAIDGAWRNGHTPEDIESALIRKQEKNKYRQWNVDSRSTKPNLHVRDERESPIDRHRWEMANLDNPTEPLAHDERETNP